MNSTIKLYFTASSIGAILLATTPLAFAATPPAPGPPLCVAQISTTVSPSGPSGTEPNVTQPFTTPSACHGFARSVLSANQNWASPAKVCARYADGKTHVVEVTDYDSAMGNAAGVNRDAGYTVTCDGPTNVVQMPTTPTVVPGTL
jgi:hypothetical protein